MPASISHNLCVRFKNHQPAVVSPIFQNKQFLVSVQFPIIFNIPEFNFAFLITPHHKKLYPNRIRNKIIGNNDLYAMNLPLYCQQPATYRFQKYFAYCRSQISCYVNQFQNITQQNV